MTDDWQDAAFSNRHTHNRGQRGRGGKANSHGFNVLKTFGSYEIKSSKFPSSPDGAIKAATLEIYTLNDMGNALIGELFIPGCLNANILMAGSHKVMKQVMRDLVEKDGLSDFEPEEDLTGSAEEVAPKDEDDEGAERSGLEERKERQKAQEFEKNSFRSPKFWLKWQGQLANDEGEQDLITDGGHVVFSGNSCQKFDGTLSCEKLGWRNAKVTGWKIKGMPARDFDIQWTAEKEGES